MGIARVGKGSWGNEQPNQVVLIVPKVNQKEYSQPITHKGHHSRYQ